MLAAGLPGLQRVGEFVGDERLARGRAGAELSRVEINILAHGHRACAKWGGHFWRGWVKTYLWKITGWALVAATRAAPRRRRRKSFAEPAGAPVRR